MVPSFLMLFRVTQNVLRQFSSCSLLGTCDNLTSTTSWSHPLSEQCSWCQQGWSDPTLSGLLSERRLEVGGNRSPRTGQTEIHQWHRETLYLWRNQSETLIWSVGRKRCAYESKYVCVLCPSSLITTLALTCDRQLKALNISKRTKQVKVIVVSRGVMTPSSIWWKEM